MSFPMGGTRTFGRRVYWVAGAAIYRLGLILASVGTLVYSDIRIVTVNLQLKV